MKQLASQGKTVLVSSHLMNEMAVTADHLIVIGRGRLLADAATEEVISSGSGQSVRVRTPDPDRLTELIAAEGGKAVPAGADQPDAQPGDEAPVLIVTGMPAARIGELAASAALVLHELTPQLASLEEAFLELTSDSLEFGHPRYLARPHGGEFAMSAATAPGQLESAASQIGGSKAGFGHLMLAEWTKIRSVRSTVWTLLLFVIITIGLTALLSWLTVSNWNGPRAPERDARILADPVGFIFGAGIGLGQLTICVLGVLLMSTEYSTGVIRASLLAVPKRLPMLAAKLAVFGLLMLVLAELVAFGSFFVGSALLHSKVAVALSDSGVLRATLGAGLYLTVLGLFAVGVGALLRHTAGAISTVIGVVLVVPILASLLPGNWGAHVNAYLPEQAGSLIFAVHQTGDQLLSASQGFGVLCIWTLLVLGAAAYLLDRRDA